MECTIHFICCLCLLVDLAVLQKIIYKKINISSKRCTYRWIKLVYLLTNFTQVLQCWLTNVKCTYKQKLQLINGLVSHNHNNTVYKVSIKRFLKRNLANVGMNQWMHRLTEQQTRNSTQWYALHNMATLFNNHPYISSSGTSVGTLNLLLLM